GGEAMKMGRVRLIAVASVVGAWAWPAIAALTVVGEQNNSSITLFDLYNGGKFEGHENLTHYIREYGLTHGYIGGYADVDFFVASWGYSIPAAASASGNPYTSIPCCIQVTVPGTAETTMSDAFMFKVDEPFTLLLDTRLSGGAAGQYRLQGPAID